MKVLVSFPMLDKQTGDYVKNGFEELGCEVKVVDPRTEVQKLVPIATSFKPDFIFCAREMTLVEPIKIVKRDLPQVKTVCYNVDARFSATEWGPLLELFNTVDLYYCKPRGNVKESQKLCPNTVVKYLTEGMDPRSHKKECLIDDDFKKYGFDVAFAGTDGSIYTTPRPYGRAGLIKYLINSGVNLKLISYNLNGKDKFLGEDHNKLCQCSKIILGCCGWADVDLANSARDFRVTAAGGFLLTEYVKGMEEFFELGKECVTYTTPQDCVEKINYYLAHDEERKEIAERGYQRCIKDHTFAKRFEKVLKDVKEL